MSTSTSTQAEQVTCTGNNHFNCSRGCSTAPLTLWDREIITGRGDIRCRDDETGTWFCGDCLADLPADPYDQCSHICGETSTTVEAPVEHKTRTFCPRPETGTFDKRGRPVRDRSAAGICTCGWAEWHDNRELARRAAREHRANSEGN